MPPHFRRAPGAERGNAKQLTGTFSARNNQRPAETGLVAADGGHAMRQKTAGRRLGNGQRLRSFRARVARRHAPARSSSSPNA